MPRQGTERQGCILYKISDIINKIHCADCLDFMQNLPDNCVDLVVTSPPYNTGGKSLGYHPNSKTGDSFYGEYKDDLSMSDYEEFLSSRISESIRVSRYAFWNIQMLSGNKDTVLWIMSAFRKNIKDIAIWRKQAVAQIQKGRTAKGYELVIMFGRDDSMTFEYNNFPSNGYVPNIIELYKTEAIPEHHATFPLRLPYYFVDYFCKETDLILDPFCGSGTTCVAAKMLGRNYIGIDISEEYCQIARDRIKAVETGVPVKEARAGQKGLFDKPEKKA